MSLSLQQIANVTGGVLVTAASKNGSNVEAGASKGKGIPKGLSKEDEAILTKAGLKTYTEFDTANVSCKGRTMGGYFVFEVSLVSKYNFGKFYVPAAGLRAFAKKCSNLGHAFAVLCDYVN